MQFTNKIGNAQDRRQIHFSKEHDTHFYVYEVVAFNIQVAAYLCAGSVR